jgi:peptide/nickel transport system substrate-binding protein
LLLLTATTTIILYQSRRSPLESAVAATAVAPTATNPPSTEQTPTVPNARFVEAVSLDADSLNPIYTTNPTSLRAIRKILPALVGQDPYTGMSNGAGLAERWYFSEDGRTLTFSLYEDWQWSDGAPVTARDVLFTYTLIREPAVASPYRQNFANVAAVEYQDDRTLLLRLTTPDCTIFQTLRQPILPAHLYQADVAQFLAADPNRLLTVGAGPFLYEAQSAGQLTLVRNPTYRFGAPLIERYIYQRIDDTAQQLVALQEGRVDLVQLPLTEMPPLQPSATITRYSAPLDSLTFLAVNLADPAQPTPGRSAEGALLPQPPHPILSDLRVRQALAYALDYPALLAAGFANQAVHSAGYLAPTITWAYDSTLAPYAYDPARAIALLDEAGWAMTADHEVRMRDGLALRLSLLTNDDSPARVRMGELIQQQLQAIGVGVEFGAVPFDQVTGQLLAQRYDLTLIGWDTLGAEPANSDFWLSYQDLPTGAATTTLGGANFVSYQDAEVDQWLEEARTAADSDGGYRAARYRQVQARIHEDLPYIVIGAPLQSWAYRTEWQGILPQPWQFDYNIHRWWQAAE